jgi:hypothetical protein
MGANEVKELATELYPIEKRSLSFGLLQTSFELERGLIVVPIGVRMRHTKPPY